MEKLGYPLDVPTYYFLATGKLNLKIKRTTGKKSPLGRPAWKSELTREIKVIRCELSILGEIFKKSKCFDTKKPKNQAEMKD